MSLHHGLLGLLNYSDMTGYELANAFNDSLSFFWQAQTSQIYRELNKMEEQGLLSSRLEYQTGKPNKRIYSLIEAGRKELMDWINADLSEQLMPTKNPILLRLFFSSLRSAEDNITELKKLYELYQKHLTALMSVPDKMNEYKEYANTDADVLYWDLTADFGRAYTMMCLEWIASSIKRLEAIKE